MDTNATTPPTPTADSLLQPTPAQNREEYVELAEPAPAKAESRENASEKTRSASKAKRVGKWLTRRAKQYNYASYDCNAKVLDANRGSQRCAFVSFMNLICGTILKWCLWWQSSEHLVR